MHTIERLDHKWKLLKTRAALQGDEKIVARVKRLRVRVKPNSPAFDHWITYECGLVHSADSVLRLRKRERQDT